MTALRQKLLFVADFSITEQDVRENLYRFAPYDVDVDIIEISMGADENERAQYILKTETAGPEWFTPPAELLEKAAGADIIVTDFVAIGSRVIEAAKRLKLIGVTRSGVENVNLACAGERGVAVVCSPGRVAAPVADYTVGMIIAESRNIAKKLPHRQRRQLGRPVPQLPLFPQPCRQDRRDHRIRRDRPDGRGAPAGVRVPDHRL